MLSILISTQGEDVMSEQYNENECLEWLDALEIGFDLSEFDIEAESQEDNC